MIRPPLLPLGQQGRTGWLFGLNLHILLGAVGETDAMGNVHLGLHRDAHRDAMTDAVRAAATVHEERVVSAGIEERDRGTS